MKRMLINVTHGVRVALVNGNKLENLEIERTQAQKVNNIYLGKVNRVEPSLGAAFVDYGSDRDGFLPAKEVAREYFKPGYKPSHGERPNIRDILEPGQEIIIQVVKEQRGNKGAALRTFVSLAGRYLVLMPNNPRAGGISRQIEGDERDELKSNISQLDVPEGMGVIVRTAGVGRSLEELKWDFDFLLSQWDAIKSATKQKPAPFLIYQESDVITRALRDNLKPDIQEILIDDKEAYEHAKEHLAHTRPEFIDKLKLYQDSDPLFNRFEVEAQIESAFHREVKLDNGASIVIDPTEALTAIDINSARATEGADIEETAFNTNLAAADEIARQLRLRDIGGLIVIDFIDMTNPKHQREVEARFRGALQNDRARVQMGRITRFGLLEMSRQRLQPSLGDANQVTCPTCDGQGTIRGVESLTLSILRVLEEESMKPQCAQVRAQVPVDVATYLINEKRETLLDIEHRHGVSIFVIANNTMSIPHYEVTRVKADELPRNPKSSYKFATEHRESIPQPLASAKQAVEEPAIKQIKPDVPPPPAKSERKDTGFMRRLWEAVFKSSKVEEEKSLTPQPRDINRGRHSHKNKYKNDRSRNRQNRRGGSNRRNRQNQQNEQVTEVETNAVPVEAKEITNKDAKANNRDGNKGNNRRDNRRKNPRQDKRNPSQSKGPQSKQSDANNQSNQGMPGARTASADELAMHKSQVEQEAKQATPEPQQRTAASTQAKPPVAAPVAKLVAPEPVVEAPVVVPVKKLTPEEAGFRQASRRNQTQFFVLSQEEAKKAFIELVIVKQPEQGEPLKQVSTDAQIEKPQLVAAPLSKLAVMPSKPKVVVESNDLQQDNQDNLHADAEPEVEVSASNAEQGS